MQERPSNEFDERRAQRLIADMVERVRADLPDWTDAGSGDPGITLLDLFAFLTETLLYRAGRIPERTEVHLRATVERLGRMLATRPGVFVAVDGQPWRQISDFSEASSEDAVFGVERDNDGGSTVRFGDGVQGRCPPDGVSVAATFRDGVGAQDITVASRWPFEPGTSLEVEWSSGSIRFLRRRSASQRPIRRVRYFTGQILRADDLRDEQNYFRDKVKRHNKYLHGAGIVEGLEITGSSGRLRIGAGYALDASGNEIVIPAPMDIPLPQTGDHAYVVLRYAEREAAPVPVPSGDRLQCSRIEESCDILLEPAPDECSVTVARIVRKRTGWDADTGYAPPKARG
jgi:hypothetical protein